jgi:hypothetical protein
MNKNKVPQQSDQSYSLQVPRLPQSYMKRIRIHCAVHNVTVREFVISAVTAAMDAAEKKGGKR